MEIKTRRNPIRGSLATGLLFCALAVAAEAVERDDIVPSDVYAAAARVQSNVDQLRFYMGKPPPPPLHFTVTGAQPREVYFAAVALYEKANEFATQMTGIGHSAEIPLEIRRIVPANVYSIVMMADQRVLGVMQHFGLKFETRSPAWGDTKTPSDVYMLLLNIGSQINVLMDSPFSPSDVYREVTRASEYTRRLLDLYENYNYPREPDFRPGLTPRDVHGTLMENFDLMRAIAGNLGIPMLKVEPYSDKPGELVPGDVYDVATLLVAELAYIYVESKATIPVTTDYFPGRRWPSHVFRKAELLKSQLSELNRLTAKDPAPIGYSAP